MSAITNCMIGFPPSRRYWSYKMAHISLNGSRSVGVCHHRGFFVATTTTTISPFANAPRRLTSTSIPRHESFGTAPPLINLSNNLSSSSSSTSLSSKSDKTTKPSRLWQRMGVLYPHQLMRDIKMAAQFNQGFQYNTPLRRHQQHTPQMSSLSVDEDGHHEDEGDDYDGFEDENETLSSFSSFSATTTTALKSNDDSSKPPTSSPPFHKWDIEFCRTTISSFTKYLEVLAQQSQAKQSSSATTSTESTSSSSTPSQETTNHMQHRNEDHHHHEDEDDDTHDMRLIEQALLSSETISHAFKALLRCQYPTPQLALMVRDLERLLGQITIPTKGDTKTRQRLAFTDEVSLRLLEANSKAGNVGRAMTLLELRKQYKFRPRRNEFVYTVTSLQAAGLQYRVGSARNIYRSRIQQELLNPVWVDDPTRWLDTILLNMSEREFPLDLELANHMIRCFSTTGKSAKALHFFYQVYETYELVPNKRRTSVVAADTTTNVTSSVLSSSVSPSPPLTVDSSEATDNTPRRRIRIKMNRPPPFYKVPSLAKDAKISYWIPQAPRRSAKKTNISSPAAASIAAVSTSMAHGVVQKLRSDLERQPDFANGLAAAFSFCDSLTMGCAGHAPITLDVNSYNLLLSACVNQGALFRALSLLHETMPRQGVTPNIVSYNTVLVGLARVADVTTMMELWVELQSSKHVEISHFTVKYMVEGMLNCGDVTGATSFVQAAFNQHVVLPPFPVHLKMLEMALGLDLFYEARRHVQFIQQIWKWQPNEYHTPRQVGMVRAQQRQRQLSKEALQQLFQYFGQDLPESDFY